MSCSTTICNGIRETLAIIGKFTQQQSIKMPNSYWARYSKRESYRTVVVPNSSDGKYLCDPYSLCITCHSDMINRF